MPERSNVQANPQNKDSVFQFFKNMSAHLPMPLYWMDLDWVVQGANESGCKLFEFSAENLFVGKTLFDLYPHQMAKDIASHNAETILAGQIYTQELSLIDEEGKVWSFNAMKIPLKDAAGKIIGIAVSPNSALVNADILFKVPKKTIEYVQASNDSAKFSFADLHAAESVEPHYGLSLREHQSGNKFL